MPLIILLIVKRRINHRKGNQQDSIFKYMFGNDIMIFILFRYRYKMITGGDYTEIYKY